MDRNLSSMLARHSNVKLFCLSLLAPLWVAGQVPKVAAVDFYGLRKVPKAQIEKALDLKPGSPIPGSKAAMEERLEQLPGVVLARLEAVCCEGKDAILFVGIEEKGAAHFSFRSPPAGAATLPAELVATYRQFLEALEQAARKGRIAEDLTQGHPLSVDADVRQIQNSFVSYAADHLEILRDVLRNSSDDEQRAIAAAVIGYAPDKKLVVEDLELAMQDSDEAVRANSIRALSAVAVLASREPGRRIRISPTWFVEMLNSIVLSDRERAAKALVNLTDRNAQNTLALIRERALPAVVEMARWHSLEHALPAYVLLGRMAGLTEEQIHESWTDGERETVIQKILAPARRKTGRFAR